MTTASTTLRRLRTIAGPAPLNAPGLVTVDGDTWTAAINGAGGVAVRNRLARDSEHWRTTFEAIAEYGTQYTTTVSDILTWCDEAPMMSLGRGTVEFVDVDRRIVKCFLDVSGPSSGVVEVGVRGPRNAVVFRADGWLAAVMPLSYGFGGNPRLATELIRHRRMVDA